MNLEYITDYLDKKINENSEYINISFFELRVKEKLTKNETDEFLKYAKIRLENLRYKVYLTGDKYLYNNEVNMVCSNELLVAIKSQKK